MRDTSYYANMGIVRPGGSSLIDKRVSSRLVHHGDDAMNAIEENLNRLTLDIPDI